MCCFESVPNIQYKQQNIKMSKAKRLDLGDDLHMIIDKLYLGNRDGSEKKQALKLLGITHIVVGSIGIPAKYPDDFVYAHADILNEVTFPIHKFFPRINNFIKGALSQGGGVLVHDQNGTSSAPTLIIAYLMEAHRMSQANASAYVKLKNSQIYPNSGFNKQLTNFEKQLHLEKDTGKRGKSNVVQHMVSKEERQYKLFRGVNDSNKITQIAETVGNKIGIDINKGMSPLQMKKASILGSGTPLENLKQTDLHQLALYNTKECKFDKQCLASSISQDVSLNYFGQKKASLQTFVSKMQSKNSLLPKTPNVLTSAGESQIKVYPFLPKTSRNHYKPQVQAENIHISKTHQPQGLLRGLPAPVNRPKEVKIDMHDQEQRYNSKYIPKNPDIVSAMQDMRLKLSNQELGLQAKFSQVLGEALVEPKKETENESATPFFCKACDSYLFSMRDLKAHIPRYVSQFKEALPDATFPSDLFHNELLETSRLNTSSLTNTLNNMDLSPSNSQRPEQQMWKKKTSKVAMGQRLSCVEHFVVRKEWMHVPMEPNDSGELICPRNTCAVKVGIYSMKGLKCTCDAWIRPGFLIYKSKINKGFHNGE